MTRLENTPKNNLRLKKEKKTNARNKCGHYSGRVGIRNSYGNYNSQTKEACAKYQTYQSELEATGISANCEARENDDGQHRDCLRKFSDTLGKANRYAHKCTTNVIGNVT